MKIKKYVWCIFFLFFGLNSNGQGNLSLKGIVTEINSEFPLARATLNLGQGGQTLHTTADSKGHFSFGSLKKGKYQLVTTYVGFNSDTLRLNLDKDTIIRIGLKGQYRQLTEVVIKSGVPPAAVRNDTISFNAQSYASRPNATVEELLRKLPGINIDADGNVTMQGQKVDKILIDGKTFFIDDLRKATHNLPADIIAQVEVYDSQSDADKKAGLVSQGGSKTINLKIKKKNKEGLVGKVYAGAGNDGAYAAGGNITGLGARLFSVDVKNNNIGDQFTGTENNFTPPAAGNPQSTSIRLNYKQDFGKKLTINAFADRDGSQSSQQSSTAKQTFLADSSLLQNNRSTSFNHSYYYSAGLNAEYNPDTATYLSYNVSLSPSRSVQNQSDTTLLQTLKNNSIYPASGGSTRNYTLQSGDNFSQLLEISHSFRKPRRALRFSFSQSLVTQNQQQDLYTLVLVPNAAASIINQHSVNPVSTDSYHANVLYAEPVAAGLNLHVSASLSLEDNSSNKSSFNYDAATGLYSLPDSMASNHFNDRVSTSQFGFSLSSLPQQKLYYQVGLGGQSSTQNNRNLTSGGSISKTFTSLLPEAQLRYNMGKGESMQIYYSGSSQDPTIEQLQPLPDLSNPYLVKVGNPELRQAFNQRLYINFLNFNAENFRNLQLGINGDFTTHSIGSSTTTLAGGLQQVEFVNLGDTYQLAAGATYGFPLIDPKHGSGSISSGLTAGQERSIINNIPNSTQSKGITGELRINYHAGNKVLLESNAGAAYLDNKYSASPAANGRTLEQHIGLNADISLPLSLLAGGHYNYELHSTTGLIGQKSTMLNVYLARDLDTMHKAQVRLSGFNMLNTAAAINQSAGPNFIQTQQTTSEHRLVLLSFIYNFKKFNSRE